MSLFRVVKVCWISGHFFSLTPDQPTQFCLDPHFPAKTIGLCDHEMPMKMLVDVGQLKYRDVSQVTL